MNNLVKTFEEACQAKGIDPEKVLPDFSCYPEEHRPALIAAAKLFIILDVVREGKKFDYNNMSERKFYPWWDLEKDEENNPSGFRFGAAFYVHVYSYVGSRLSLRSTAEVEHVVEHFEPLYRDLIAP